MKNIKIQSKILLFFIISAVLPLLVLILVSSRLIFANLEKSSFLYYSTLLKEVSNNIDFVYGQTKNTLTNLMTLSNVRSGLTSKPFVSADEELAITNMVVGYEGVKVGSLETMETGMRQTIEEKIDGYCILYQLNKESIIDGTSYKGFKSSRYVMFPNYETLYKDPLFQKLYDNEQLDMVFGKVNKDVFPSGSVKQVYDVPIVLFPYKIDKDSKDKFDTLLFVAFSYGFIEKFYEDIKDLKNGTLYIVDQFDNLLSHNHPNDNDYFTFDDETHKYILEDRDSKFDDETEMSYNDYNLLNTNSQILEDKEVKKLLNSKKTNLKTIKFNGIKYLSLVEYSQKSQLKFIYFQPVDLIRKPIYSLVKYIFIITILLILIVVIISILFTKSFTTPINLLVNSTKKISEGNYNELIKLNSKDELCDLATNFNSMVKSIKLYQDKLLSKEREKQEMFLASKIQTCLLPKEFDYKHYDIGAKMIPADEVGGDYFDIIVSSANENKLWLGIGDVSGHGLTSGLIMMMAQTAFNTILLNDPDISTDELIVKVNRVLYQNIKERLNENHFMTLSFLMGDKDGHFKYSGAHLDMLIYRYNSDTVEVIRTTGVWLGIVENMVNKVFQQTFDLSKNDVLLLYTDGLIESINENDELYGMERLIDKFKSLGKESVTTIESEIVKDAINFTKNQLDDITVLVVKKKS